VNVSATDKYSEEDHYGVVSDSAAEPPISQKKAVRLEVREKSLNFSLSRLREEEQREWKDIH
jgi:hypothetical protein